MDAIRVSSVPIYGVLCKRFNRDTKCLSWRASWGPCIAVLNTVCDYQFLYLLDLVFKAQLGVRD